MPESQADVTAILNYLDPSETAPKSYIDPPSDGRPVRRPRTVAHEMAIRDIRAVAGTMTLDAQGLALLTQESEVGDFYDAGEVEAVYYDEAARMVKAATGAARVHVFDHNVRNANRAEVGRNGARMPVRFVHNDYTVKSGPQRVRDLLAPGDGEAMLEHRFCLINVWRPIRGPVQDAPLAVCDARSMAPDDFVPTDLIYSDRVGEVYSVRHSSAHRWYYVPEMGADEVMLLKCYDSEDDGRARFTAHSAFRNPASPEDARPRESIEVRTIAFFAPLA